MSDTLATALVGLVAGMVTGLIAIYATRDKIGLDLAAGYDKELHDSRLAAYKLLWAMLEPLARYGRAGPLSLSEVRAVSNETKRWYFQTGGIYLTEHSRTPYFDMKAEMEKVLVANLQNTDGKNQHYESILRFSSTLRTALSDDIGTKRLSRVR